ncbi:MAG: FtsX-like permease family protein [Gemmatimonadetes bacterium]|nr:FtsX-like permease family protein [Gemmatimonadota bacterium]NIW35587.1 FtsX-like permease family protein [Gemmatimonadota bacterium]
MREIRSSLRSLERAPGFTAVAAVTLALGIGANSAIFGLVNSVLIQPLPYPDSDRLVTVRHQAPGLGVADAGQSAGTFFHYRAHSVAFEEMGLYLESKVNITGEGPPERVDVALVTPGVFSALRARAERGRLFGVDDGRPGAPTVVIISHGLWVERFGGDPDIVGRTIEVNQTRRRIIGVLPSRFDFPSRETRIWYNLSPDLGAERLGSLDYEAVGRLAPGVAPADGEADLARLIPSLADAYPDVEAAWIESSGLRPRIEPLKKAIVGDVGSVLWIALGAVVIVLLIAGANVGNLFLARAEGRQREVTVRSALGARRIDLFRQFLTESLMLALAAGVLGLILAKVVVSVLRTYPFVALPRLHEIGLDAWTVAFTVGVSALVGTLLAVIPVVRYRRPDLVSGLREAGRGSTMSRPRQRTQRALVVSQLALALPLLTASGLLLQSFWRLTRVEPGFQADGVLTFQVNLPYRAYPEFDDASSFYRSLLGRLGGLPGVTGTGAVSKLPLSGDSWTDFAHRLRSDAQGVMGEERTVIVKLVAPGYFESMGIPWLEGQRLTSGSTAVDHPIVLNRALASRLFPGVTAVGKRVFRVQSASGGDERVVSNTVVAVVGDVRDRSLSAGPTEIAYLPILAAPLQGYVPRAMNVVVRAEVESRSLLPTIRRTVAELDPSLPVVGARSMTEIVARSMERTTFTLVLLGVAGATALFLGAVGMFGVMSYAVSRRTGEIGVRVALGARGADIQRMILRQSAVLVMVGLVVGGPAALGLSRFLRATLFEISPVDPLTLVATAVLLASVALAASYLPARRAAAVEPVSALRSE